MLRRQALSSACLAVGLSFLSAVGFAQTATPAADAAPSASPTYIPLKPEEGAEAPPAIHVEPIPDTLRADYRIDPFYKKCTVIDGIPIIGSEKVSDFAFLECAWTLDHLLHGRKMALEALLKSKVRVGIIAVTEYTMDIPENQRPRMLADGAYNDRRSRGLGGLPLATCAEENLLNLRGDPYVRENITIHEFSHTVASAIQQIKPEWFDRLIDAQMAAKARGDYGNSYAISNKQEYWAEGAQCWFDCANPRNAGGASNRKELKAKDEALVTLLTEVYGDEPWRYTKIADRHDEADLAHLAGFDRTKLPIFSFANSPRIQAQAQNGGGRGGAKSEDGKATPNSDGKNAEEKSATPPPASDAANGK
jgi:hypothetical protein